jgi:riboflavin kinase/FMN adenylyltransferase
MAEHIVTIGNFDGVHVGHAALVERARELAGDGRVTAMAFDPHPASVLRPGTAPDRLTTFERRSALLREAGADEVVRLEPTTELLGMSARAFVESVVRERAPTGFVEGDDFRFGRGREGTIETLRDLGDALGFAVDVIAPLEVVLEDQTVARASSTTVRWLLEHGRVGDTTRMLGRSHEIEGVVVEGDRRGRRIGYPTANVESTCMAPGDGVYAGVAHLPDGRVRGAAVSVGSKPTFDGAGYAVEAYLLDVEREGDRIAGLSEYGWSVRLELLGWVRDQVRFGSAESLVEQIDRDCARVREIVDRAACAEAGA